MTPTPKPILAFITAAIGAVLATAPATGATDALAATPAVFAADSPPPALVEANFKFKKFKKFHGHRSFGHGKIVSPKLFVKKKLAHPGFIVTPKGFKKKVFVKKKFF